MANQTRADSNLRHTVPYAPWSQFKHFLDKIKVLNPRIIDAEYLRSNQMGGQQPGPLMTAIRFLGLVNADRTPTDRLEQLRVRGEQQFTQALEKVIRDAYSELFNAVNVEEADRDTIYNQIRSVYQCSPRLAETATPLFLALAHEAGMNVATSLPKGTGATERNARQTIKAARKQGSGSGQESGSLKGRRRSNELYDSKSDGRGNSAPIGRSTNPEVHINLQIHIDASASPEQIEGIFEAMAKHLYRAEGSGGYWTPPIYSGHTKWFSG